MSRSVEEWFGQTQDTPVPTRVRIRIWEKFGRKCCKCQRPLRSGDRWDIDHTTALINGGENRESNLQVLCSWCHREKSREDVREKAHTYRCISKTYAGSRYGAAKRLMPFGRKSALKKKINGQVVLRDPVSTEGDLNE